MKKLGIIVIAIMLIACESFPQETEAAVKIQVSNTIVAEDIEALGANMSSITGGTNFLNNNLFNGTGFEPTVARYLIRIENFGEGWIEWFESDGGVHMWDQNATGYGDGAQVRLYRIVNSAGEAFFERGQMENANQADRVIFLGETQVPEGGWIAEGSESSENRVYLEDKSIELAYGDYAMITVQHYMLEKDDVHPRLHQWFSENLWFFGPGSESSSTSIVPHTASIPSDFTDPGDGCLRFDVNARGGDWAGQWVFHAYDEGEGRWYSQLTPGTRYRAEAWLRQEGLDNGEVYFLLGGAYSGKVDVTPWNVSDEWQHFTFDFIGPDFPLPGSWHGNLGIETTSSGTVWMDNFMVYQYDEEHNFEPLGPHTLAFNEIMAALPQEGPKPALRFYNTTYPTHSSIERLLSYHPNHGMDFIYNTQGTIAMSIPLVMEWAMETGTNADNRIIPYITLSEEFTEEEWLAIVEYLGVPYDPESDTPQDLPWAYRRYQQRGHGKPWTDEFREIILEMGNETWHAGVFAGWHGFGRPGWVWEGGREYGLFARYYLYEHVAAKDWWEDNNLADKITFSINAGYDASPNAYGELAVQQIPELSVYLGHANYVGPKWETDDEILDVYNDQGMQDVLIGAYESMFPLLRQIGETRNDLKDAGLADYHPIAYEGGPSGYFLPGQGTEAQVAATELYGKSVGMAVSALDAWLYSSLIGYKHQEFFSFGSGSAWNSHTMPNQGGFRRHTGWLALMIRNLYAQGTDMLETAIQNNPSIPGEGTIPALSSYSIQGENSLSIFILNRSLDQEIPVTLELPITSCTSITRYTLADQDGDFADPRLNNIEEENVVIGMEEVSARSLRNGRLTITRETGGSEGGLPAGNFVLYVFEY
jgi:hypothetical protein